ncbi:Ca2+-binding RTX toxin-like protein [Sphingomonas sp. F9_3S_D5_B_2]
MADIYGTNGNDNLFGTSGDDFIDGGLGADRMDGGTGDDVYAVDNPGDLVVEDPDSGEDVVYTTLETYTLPVNVEHLIYEGDEFAAFDGTGNSLDNYIEGWDGDDVLTGLTGDDILEGLGGDDQLIGGTGDDIYGVEESGDVVVEAAGEGIDTVSTTLGEYTLGANVEALIFAGDPAASFTGTGNSLDNYIEGYDANDTLDGGAGADELAGLNGDDVYLVDDVNDTVTENASEGYDVVLASSATYTLGANVEALIHDGATDFTGSGNDLDNYLEGGSGDDVLSGGAGNDILDGAGGSDRLKGETGDDVYYLDEPGALVIENANEGLDEVFTTLSSYSLTANVEYLIYDGSGRFTGNGNNIANYLQGNAGDDSLSGAGGDDFLSGHAGSDRLYGDAGNDGLDGGLGADKMVGGTGDDTFFADNSGDIAYENAGEGSDEVIASVSYALRDNVEDLVLTGIQNLTGKGNAVDNDIFGNAANNSLYGYGGNDRLSGDAGNDTLDGGTGIDGLYGGAGNDTYYVNSSTAYAYENAGEGTDRVISSISTQLRANVENLSLSGASNLTGKGNELANTLTGNTANNALYGYAGDDKLYGGDGNDVLNGGSGVDRLSGGTGNDTYYVDDATSYAYENAAEGTDRVYATVSLTLRANIENLTLSGASAINGSGNEIDNRIWGNGATNALHGAAGNDKLYGQAGDDTLSGDDGNDWLEGGTGKDVAYGGAGKDTFVFRDGDFAGATTGSADVIHDFVHGDDHIRLDYFDADTVLGGNQAFSFIGTAAFDGTAGELRYEAIGGATYVSGDTNGDGTADFMLRLDGNHPLTSGDFAL